ncbi:S66 peptidase family protein [Brevibacillus massiliensis]|uniref:S66 peptidase family protein n=1 Tax=Brevibacillus massiliensis TaxID=1118054 RepID=UPI0002E1B871|nr:LD-carboxypeptidase [Brevibacillus massiliensis]
MRKGKVLKPGDTIGVPAPSSPDQLPKVEAAKKRLEGYGFKVKTGECCYQTYGGYLAGTPENRAKELMRMFTDPDVDGMICLRGGYGTPQILHLLDYRVIADHPKLFVGYSDITALHIAFQKKAELATLHGPMTRCKLDDHSREFWLRALTQAAPLGQIVHPEAQTVTLVPGRCQGQVVGGNLSLITAAMGTPYEIDTRGKILFIEDVGEEPYRVDRMLTQLALAGKFAEAEGIVLGTWEECEPKEPDSFSVVNLFHNIIAPFRKPTIYNLQVGHGERNLALPLGVLAGLDATAGSLTILESLFDS